MKINEDHLYKKIGENIKVRRKNLRITQADLSKEVGMSRTSLVNIENGKQRVSLYLLYLLAKSLDLRIKDILPKIEELIYSRTKLKIHGQVSSLPLVISEFIE